MNEMTTIDRTQREYSAAVKEALARKPQLFINGEWVDSSGDATIDVEDPSSGVDFSRVVHGEQRFTHHRPAVAGDRLVAALTVQSVRRMAGNDLVTMRNDITTTDGEPVCTSTSMLVVRGE